MDHSHQVHPFPPLFDDQSRILILGSFPSVKSRQGQFFYHHPQNRFWQVTAALFGVPLPRTIEEKSAMLHANHAALWDVIASCDITGSSDSSIRNAVPNDLRPILEHAPIQAIFCNGGASWNCYNRYTRPSLGIEAYKLPSTSPANAAWSLDRLIDAWKVILLPSTSLDILHDIYV